MVVSTSSMTTKYPDESVLDKERSSGFPHQRESPVDEGEIIHDYPDGEKLSFATRLGVTPDSFRRRRMKDSHNQLNQTMKARHLNMIAIGGSIGAGLFVGSGGALSRGGPAALVIDFSIIGIVRISHI